MLEIWEQCQGRAEFGEGKELSKDVMPEAMTRMTGSCQPCLMLGWGGCIHSVSCAKNLDASIQKPLKPTISNNLVGMHLVFNVEERVDISPLPVFDPAPVFI